MEALLAPGVPLDIALLDRVVEVFYDPMNPQRGAADAVLSALKARPDSWIQVDAILDRSTNVKSKFFALSVLEDLIRFRWKLLPADQREAVRGFIVGKVIAMCGDEARMAAERMFVAKLNMILVQVLKQEWPQNWPSFVTDIVGSSKTSEILCENNLEILKLLSEEVFDFSKNEITSLRVKTLKESLHADFDQIYQLCDFVLNHATRPTLLRGALQTLSRFVSWIPIQYVFETTLLEILCLKFLPNPTYRLHATECLAEISSLVLDARYHGRVVSMYVAAMTQLVSMIPVSVPIPKLYQAGSPEDKMFFQRLALFLTSFFTQSLPLLEAAVMSGTMPAEVLLTGMLYLIGITDNDESEIFKLCLDFWLHFSNTLYDAEKAFVSANPVLLAVPSAQIRSPRKELYLSVLPRLREVLIRHTPKPEEVLIEKDDSGDIVRSTTKDTDAIATYKTMKDTLVFLTHLDYNDTESIMVDKLSKQVDGSEFGWDPLNSLCWAVGAISGTMNEEDEKRFLVMVIKDLLGLCEMKRGKNNKAVIASNIMYVVGQYPRFLRAHWKFLKTVVNKLFEFMHEKHPGVQDMACDTFLKICQRCKPKFVVVQTGETKMFIEELCEHVHEVISELEPHQVQTFYEAAGQMVSAHPDPNAREHLTEMLMTLPNITWANIVKAASENLETLKNPTVIKELTRVLKINDRVCKSVGPSFSKQMGRIFLEMMNLYKAFSQFVSTSIQLSGEAITRTTVVKLMRKAKRDVLNVIDTFVSKSNAPKFIAEAFLPHLLDPLLSDYAANIPAARNPEVLSVMTSCVLKLKEDMSMHVPKVMAGVFRSTLEMLRVTYVDFPEHRLNFFKLLEGIVNNCFAALFSMDGDTVKMFVDSLMWGFKHPQRDIAETALGILMVVMDQIASKDATAQPFFKAYFVSLLKDVFEVLTDRMHKSAFKCHCQIVGAMFQMLHSGRVTVPLFEPSAFGPDMTNVRFVCEILASALLAAFPHLSPPRVQAFIIGIYPASREEPTLKCHMRDFLIEMKEFAEDNAELFHEEAIAAAAAAASEDLERRRAVPGLLAATAADLDEL